MLGIDPDAQGLRLGRALTDLGLAHLRGRGLAQVLLYVEEDNAAAVRLYEGRGFTPVLRRRLLAARPPLTARPEGRSPVGLTAAAGA